MQAAWGGGGGGGGRGGRGTGEIPFLPSASLEKSLLRADGNVCRVFFRLPQKAFCLATKSLSERSS